MDGLAKSAVEGDGFRHAVYARTAGAPDGTLRIYLDGDGDPYWGRAAARDPTSTESLTLELLAEDPGPALLLGRPCYHGESGTTKPCTPDLWTTARYGEAVVASMVAAARRLIAARGVRSVTLIGHSGGGAIAMLMAPGIPEVRRVVTIGGDFDVAGWSAYAGEDLSGSLDPAGRPPLPPGIVQLHYAGSEDDVVPPSIAAPGLTGGAELTIVEGYDHVCCWAEMWPRILRRLETPPG